MQHSSVVSQPCLLMATSWIPALGERIYSYTSPIGLQLTQLMLMQWSVLGWQLSPTTLSHHAQPVPDCMAPAQLLNRGDKWLMACIAKGLLRREAPIVYGTLVNMYGVLHVIVYTCMCVHMHIPSSILLSICYCHRHIPPLSSGLQQYLVRILLPWLHEQPVR